MRLSRITALLFLGLLTSCTSSTTGPGLVDRTPSQRAIAFSHAADNMVGQDGGDAMAERLYRRALADRSNSLDARIGLGRVLLRRGDIQGSRELFEQASHLAPTDGRPVAGLAAISLAQHDPRNALSLYTRALDLSPSLSMALNGVGVALDQLERHSEAEARYREILARDPNDEAARNNLGLSLVLDGRAEEAVPILSSLAMSPASTARSRQNLALALAMAGQDGAAVRAATIDEPPALAQEDVALLSVVRRALRSN